MTYHKNKGPNYNCKQTEKQLLMLNSLIEAVLKCVSKVTFGFINAKIKILPCVCPLFMSRWTFFTLQSKQMNTGC